MTQRYQPAFPRYGVPDVGCDGSRVVDVLIGNAGNSGCVDVGDVPQPIRVCFDASQHAPDYCSTVQ